MLLSIAAEERQLRISAFKNKVATLRATSKAYNVSAISGDRSINTLDSGTVTSSVYCGGDSRNGGDYASIKEASRDDVVSDSSAASSPGHKRMPSFAEYMKNPFSDSDSDESEKEEEVPATPGVTVSCEQRPPNPFFDSDSEVSSGVDETSCDSSDIDDDSHARSIEEENLYVTLSKAFRNIQNKTTAVETATNAKEELADDKVEEVEKSKAAPRPMTLDEKIGKTGRTWGASVWTSKKGATWGTTATDNSHAGSKRSSCKGSISVASGTTGSSNTFSISTDGGFSIESLRQESNDGSGSRNGSAGIDGKQPSTCIDSISGGVVTKVDISKYDIQNQVKSVSPTAMKARRHLTRPNPEDEVEELVALVESASTTESQPDKWRKSLSKYAQVFSEVDVSKYDIGPVKSGSPTSKEYPSQPSKVESNSNPIALDVKSASTKTSKPQEDKWKLSLSKYDIAPPLKPESPTTKPHQLTPPRKVESYTNLFTDDADSSASSEGELTPYEDKVYGASFSNEDDEDGTEMEHTGVSKPWNYKSYGSPFIYDDEEDGTERGASVSASTSQEGNWTTVSSADEEKGEEDIDSIEDDISTTLKAAAALLKKRKHAFNFMLKNTLTNLSISSSGSSSSSSMWGATSEDSISIANEEKIEEDIDDSIEKKMQTFHTKSKSPFDANSNNPFLDSDEDGDESIPHEDSVPSIFACNNSFTVDEHEEDDSIQHEGSVSKAPSMETPTKKRQSFHVSKKTKKSKPAKEKRQIAPGTKSNNSFSAGPPSKGTMQHMESATPERQPFSDSKLTSPRAVSENIQRQGTNDATDVESTTSTIFSSSTVAFSTGSTQTLPSSNRKKKPNPFADLLALRQATKKATDRRRNQSVGSMLFESCSSEETSMSSHSIKQRSVKTDTKRRVFYYDATTDDSLDGVLFSDLKKALTKIQLVEYKKGNSKEDEHAVGGIAEGTQEEDDDESRPADMKSQVIVRDESSSSGIISSLQDSTPELYDENIPHVASDFNDDPFEDDGDDVESVPKSPAPLESSSQIHLLGQERSDTSNDHDSSSQYKGESELEVARATQSVRKMEARGGGSRDSEDSVTVTCSNSQKVDRAKECTRASTLSPPKKGVVLRDSKPESGRSGSISTKTDSILGKTIDVGNADLVAERIYLESLHAQVLAELKVHVADEEIRLALDSRLKAIRDYYKRKATVIHLKPAAVATMPTTPPGRKDSFLEKLGALPQVQPTVLHSKTKSSDKSEQGSGHLASRSPSNDISYPQELKNSNKYAFERMQGTIGEAIDAALNTPKESSTAVPEVTEKQQEEDLTEKAGEKLLRQSTETPIPLHIFTKDTFWDDEDNPSDIDIVATSSNISPTSPTGTIAGITGVEKPAQATHEETIHNAWKFYRNVNTLIFDSRVYDYEFQLLQEDPLYPYLNSLVGIADSGMDGYANEHKRISQKVKREYGDTNPHRICHILVREAQHSLEGLKEICAYIGDKLGMQTMAVGPIKKPSQALLKSEKKYGGDPLLVTDYCRASLFVKDVASLLALIEIVLSKYANIVRRIKLSKLKCDHSALTGGYRDCKINLDIDGHICELQVHLISMWLIKEGKGYTHYKDCRDHNVDVSSFDISKTLTGLEREVLADLVTVGERRVTRTPIHQVQQYHENKIRDYFALANLYIHYGLPDKAEYILRRIVTLRSGYKDFGPCHTETLMQMELLRKSLKYQHKYRSASAISSQIKKAKKMQKQRGFDEPESLKLSVLCATDQCGAIEHVYDMVLDPNKKERQEEKRKMDAVEESRALWLEERRSFFG